MSSSALSPTVVAAIDDLELAARLVVEGLRTGGHRSPFHGYTTEFRQHRPYRAGDDLKYLDWKLYARTDRLYTRQFRETTNLSVMLALDTSASMAFPRGRSCRSFATGRSSPRRSRISCRSRGTPSGLMTMEGEKLSYVAGARRPAAPAVAARAHRRLSPAGAWDPARVIARGGAAAAAARRRDRHFRFL